MTDKERIRAEIERRVKFHSESNDSLASAYVSEDNVILSFIDSLQEESVSEDLENEVMKKILYFIENFHKAPWAIDSTGAVMPIWYAKFGAKWQKEKDQETIETAIHHAYHNGRLEMKEQMMKNIWKTADGDDLPIFDREVIVLTQPYPLGGNEYIASFAHRPNPNGWDGKSLSTGKVEHYTPKTYDKGGWSIPNVKWWLDVDKLPNVED